MLIVLFFGRLRIFMRLKRNDSGDRECREEIIRGADDCSNILHKRFNGKDCAVLKRIDDKPFLVLYLRLNHDTDSIDKVVCDGCYFQVYKRRLYDLCVSALLDKD